MNKKISTDQNKTNIDEVIRLLADTPGRLETIRTRLSDQQLRAPLAPGERTPTEILAHILNCEAITSQAIYLALLTDEPLLPDIHAERDLGKLLRLDVLSFEELLAYFTVRRTVLLRVLEPLTEKKWSRVVRQPKKARKESVYWQARGQALHEVEHLLDLETKAGKNRSEVNMLETYHLSMAELEAGMEHIRQSPRDEGSVRMIVCRPRVDERETLQEAEISLEDGLVGDTWKVRSSRHTPDGSAHKEAQVTIMNARLAELIAQNEDRWALAGDQLYVDFDLSDDNIPPGTRLALGSAILEVSAVPHTGCNKFSARFGVEAMKFVNSEEGKKRHLRGINTRVVQGGIVRVGDRIRKV